MSDTQPDVISLPARGLLIDCDGVLVDSYAAAAYAWNSWAETWRPGFDFYRDIEHGRRMVEVVASLVAPEHVQVATSELEAAEISTAQQVTAIRGARELLEACPSAHWAVVTSGVYRIAADRMTAAGLPTPANLVTGEDVTAGKPAPDPYLEGARRLGIPPAECAVFEDAPAGIAAARAAGCRTIIGVGPAALTPGATVNVPDLRGISFDGVHLTIPIPALYGPD